MILMKGEEKHLIFVVKDNTQSQIIILKRRNDEKIHIIKNCKELKI